MARMNKTARITNRPRTRKPDTHSTAVAEAHQSGLAAWAIANGFVSPDGTALVHTASQRRAVERAMARAMAERA